MALFRVVHSTESRQPPLSGAEAWSRVTEQLFKGLKGHVPFGHQFSKDPSKIIHLTTN